MGQHSLCGTLKPSAKRKSRKSIARNQWKKRKGSQRVLVDSSPCTANNLSLLSISSLSEKGDDDVFANEVQNNDTQVLRDAAVNISGRRIVDIRHVLKSIQSIEHFPGFDCGLTELAITQETRCGLKSTFSYECSMCNLKGHFTTEGDEEVNINQAAAIGAIAIGIGYSQITELCATLNIPYMARKTFAANEKKAMEIIKKEAVEEMIEAGKEERELALEAGEVDNNGRAVIPVIADGAWGKRSHGTNYNALSGVGCIVGARTKKILYIGVRNKYCRICSMRKKEKHDCFKNWTKTSTAMEASIILDGFRKSLKMHDLIYGKLIGDGDSSVYKTLRDVKPYGSDIFIEKIECRNHVLRNYIKKIKECCKSSHGDPDFAITKDFVMKNLLKFRAAIVGAIRYRK